MNILNINNDFKYLIDIFLNVNIIYFIKSYTIVCYPINMRKFVYHKQYKRDIIYRYINIVKHNVWFTMVNHDYQLIKRLIEVKTNNFVSSLVDFILTMIILTINSCVISTQKHFFNILLEFYSINHLETVWFTISTCYITMSVVSREYFSEKDLPQCS